MPRRRGRLLQVEGTSLAKCVEGKINSKSGENEARERNEAMEGLVSHGKSLDFFLFCLNSRWEVVMERH